MNFDPFYNRNLYPIPISDYLPGFEDQYLFYSPLAHSFICATTDEIQSLASQLENNGRFDNLSLSQQLIDDALLPAPNFVLSPNDVFALTILPNNTCNFACSYCYAAKGHSNNVLDESTLRSVLDFFVDPNRIQRRDLYISFGGGGEPLLSWNRVKFTIEYSHQLATQHGFVIHYSYASNGSVMNDDILQTIKQYAVKVNVSFDILEDIQEVQRKHFHVVAQTLDTLLNADIFPTINSVITPLNVERQSEMVEFIHHRFPRLKRLSFDYVVDGQLFDDPIKLRNFYDTYTAHFYAAQQLAAHYNISVSSIKYHNLEQLKTRACAGGFDLTPLGKLSMCFFVSSPQEALYDTFIYGYVDADGVHFDENRFRTLVDQSSNRRDNCQRCFIRWHCGGGCLYHQQSYAPSMLDEMCHFQRRFSLIALLNKMYKTNILDNGNSLS